MGGMRTAAGRRNGVILFTTSDFAGGRHDELLRLLGSVHEAASRDGLPIRHYILLQRAPHGAPVELQEYAGADARLFSIPDRVSLSRARNMLLACAREDGALAASMLAAFPDDDAWYPPGLLREVCALFSNSATLALATCLYGADPETLTRDSAAAAFRAPQGYGELIRTLSSNTLLLRASVVETIGGFDEQLGVGARIDGGEDLDYGLRACAAGHAILSPRVLIGHRDRLPWVRSRYFAGSLFALTRAARRSPVLGAQVLRKLLVGLALVALRELSLGDLCVAARSGLAGWNRLQPEVS